MITYTQKVKCLVCNGTGAVDPSFGSGIPGSKSSDGVSRTFISDISTKTCPACNGSGMQIVTATMFKEPEIINFNDGSEIIFEDKDMDDDMVKCAVMLCMRSMDVKYPSDVAMILQFDLERVVKAMDRLAEEGYLVEDI